MAELVGQTLGHYRIVEKIGAGGMGEVYRAHDERLGRDVAIKLLRGELTADADRVRRFEQEARTVASLSHPNILALHDVGSREGQPYLVTELLEGQTLAERIETGDLTVAKAVELATQIAHGLAAAHERGVVHRDLKPGNVFVTKDGVVKILDFGLARLTLVDVGAWDRESSPTETRLTAAGSILGTVGYMAPEQVRGLPADKRSDIFAFGCVLYEMLCGRSPFRRDTSVDTVAAILHEEPPDLAGAMKGIPPQLDGIVTRCLEKRPEDRFQSARDLAHDLAAILSEARPSPRDGVFAPGRRWWVIGFGMAAVAVLGVAGVLVFRVAAPARDVQGTKPPKIIVLPFENLGLPDDEYFAAGMTEEITSRLANVQRLGVISRTTAVQCDRSGKTVKQIGEDLGVDYVLEGSVRWDHGTGGEGRVRITPQLIRVADDTHVWSNRYDRVLADVFALQSEVAESAVTAMGVALLPREQTALRDIPTKDLEAYDLYLRGKHFSSASRARKDIESAVQMYQAAADRDPGFAQAFAGLARGHLWMYWIYFDRSQERLRKAKEAAERAVQLRPDLAESRGALGWYCYQGLLDFPRALEEFGAALRIQPNNSDVLHGVAYVRTHQGRWAEAAAAISEAVQSDPENATLLVSSGAMYARARRYADADRAYAQAIAINPRWALSYAARAELQLSWRGDLDGAEAILGDARRVSGLTDDEGHLARVTLAMVKQHRDYQTYLLALEKDTRDASTTFVSWAPISLLRGLAERLAGQFDLAHRSFEAARTELEHRIREAPDDVRLHGALGIAYAGLGRRDDAVREAKLGCELTPASKNAVQAFYRLSDLTLVYIMVGQYDEAIAASADLLARSGEFTPHDLRLDPSWDPLRSDSRFQALLTKYEVKE